MEYYANFKHSAALLPPAVKLCFWLVGGAGAGFKKKNKK